MTEQCALLARELSEPLAGTAPEAVGWICIEEPGAWGPRPPADSGLPDEVVAHLATLTGADPTIRVQLLRRDHRRPQRTRSLFLVHAGRSRRWTRRLGFDDPAELLTLPLDSVADPTPPRVGEVHDDPLVLVCTHAKRDACCALWGRPLVDALTAEHPDLVWSSTHLGGHRFAGNLVVLPHGLAYGYLQPADALRVVGRHLDGLVEIEHLRGRSSLDRASQTAEFVVRDRVAARGLDDVEVAGAVRRAADGTVRVDVRAPGRAWEVTLRQVPLGTDRAVSCGGEPTDPGTWTLVALEPVTT